MIAPGTEEAPVFPHESADVESADTWLRFQMQRKSLFLLRKSPRRRGRAVALWRRGPLLFLRTKMPGESARDAATIPDTKKPRFSAKSTGEKLGVHG